MDLHDQSSRVDSPISVKTQSRSITSSSKYHQLLRKASELLLSVSILSFILSFFTGLSFLRSYAYYFSKFLFPLVVQAFERKYMFLLCNGILVILAGKFGISSPPSPSSRQEQAVDADVIDGVSIMLQPEAPVDPLYEVEAETYLPMTVEQENGQLEVQEEEQQKEKGDHKEDSENVALVSDSIEGEEEDLGENEGETEPIVVGEDGENDDTENGPPSNNEELNKKIEEFIRKMKEELRLEAQQQQLIVA